MKWLAIIFLTMVLIVFGGIMVAGQLASRSNTIQNNISVIRSGGDNVTSDTVSGTMLLGDYMAGVSSTTDQRMGWIFTTNRTYGVANVSLNITVHVWNGSVYKSHFNFAFDCTPGQNNCEPVHQNATPYNATINRGIMNLTNSDTEDDIASIDFRINSTCTGINLTFTNNSNTTEDPVQTLDTTFRLLYGPLVVNDSFDFFIFANISGNPFPGPCGEIGTEFDVS